MSAEQTKGELDRAVSVGHDSGEALRHADLRPDGPNGREAVCLGPTATPLTRRFMVLQLFALVEQYDDRSKNPKCYVESVAVR